MSSTSFKQNTAPVIPVITRFAPSPTGLLHLGHAYSALTAYHLARDLNGDFLLRLENIDSSRCHPNYEQHIIRDLKWLGIDWSDPPRRQSDHMADYRDALEVLRHRGLIYPCFCTRKEIQDEIRRAAHAPHGPEGYLYPGTCRTLSPAAQKQKIAEGYRPAWRLHMDEALAQVGTTLFWQDYEQGDIKAQPAIMGDVVLARKETPTSYHLSCTVDDHQQNITHVVRGDDLFHAAHLHRLLQHLLGLKTPLYYHHRLLLNEQGKRYAKRDKGITLQSLREKGHTPKDIQALIAAARKSPGNDEYP